MNREDILKAAQEEKHQEGEYERQIGKKAAILAAGITVLVVLGMFYIEYYFLHRIDFGKLAVICLMSSISDLYEGIKTKKKSKIIFGVIAALLFVLFIVLYIGALFR